MVVPSLMVLAADDFCGRDGIEILWRPNGKASVIVDPYVTE